MTHNRNGKLKGLVLLSSMFLSEAWHSDCSYRFLFTLGLGYACGNWIIT